MSSRDPFSSDQRRLRYAHVKLRPEDLPRKEKPADAVNLACPDGVVKAVVAMPESGLIVLGTVRYIPFGPASLDLYTFALDGDGKPLRVFSIPGDGTKDFDLSGMAVLGGDLFAMVSQTCSGGIISTWSVSWLERLETYGGGGTGAVLDAWSIASMGAGKFVVGTDTGALVFFSHCDGRDICEVAREKAMHSEPIHCIAVCDNVIVTGSSDGIVAVWNAITRERVTVRSRPGYPPGTPVARCVSICERFVAICWQCWRNCEFHGETSISLYDAMDGYALVRVIDGLVSTETATFISHLGFVGNDFLIIGSDDFTLAFTSLADAMPVVRIEACVRVRAAGVVPDGRICVCGFKVGTLFTPPAPVADAARRHAASVFSSSLYLALADHEPLQAALLAVTAGTRSARGACRELISQKNCSRSIQEFVCAHFLLMEAVDRGEIPGELHFEGQDFYWFRTLYTTSRTLPGAVRDKETLRECLERARAAGVIESTEAVLATVISRREKVGRLQLAGEKLLRMLWKIMVDQAKADEELKHLVAEVGAIDRAQKLNALFAFVFSLVPFVGNALAQRLVRRRVSELKDQIWPLLDSTMSAGVGVQGAATPLVLDRFVARAALVSSPKGRASLSARDRTKFVEAVKAVGLSWGEFRSLIRSAAKRRGQEDVKEPADSHGSTQKKSSQKEIQVEVLGSGSGKFDVIGLNGGYTGPTQNDIDIANTNDIRASCTNVRLSAVGGWNPCPPKKRRHTWRHSEHEDTTETSTVANETQR